MSNEVIPATSRALTTADVAMSDRARQRVRDSVPPNTERAYTGDARRYRLWCDEHGRTAVPASPQTLNEYINFLADAGKAPATIERALTVIISLHTTAGLERPLTKLARASIRTYRAECAEAGRQVRKAAPITTKVLRAMVAACDPTTLAGGRDRAALLLGFSLGCRRSELAALNLADVTEGVDGMEVVIRRSKTDRNSVGRNVFVPFGTHADTCPVRAVRAWREMLAQHGRNAGPLFVKVDQFGKLGRAAAGTVTADGRLTGKAIAFIVNRAAKRAGLNSALVWSGHSLRRGFATEAYSRGAEPLRIGRHGGWQDGSPTLFGYIEDVDRKTKNPLIGIGL